MNFQELSSARPDLAFIAHWVPANAHVLDVGCGDGAMMSYLQTDKACTGYGIEIADDKLLESAQRGINVIQQDMEKGLAIFGDNSFDTVLCLQSLQMMQHVEALLRDIVRVGAEGAVGVKLNGRQLAAAEGLLDGVHEDRVDLDRGQRDDVVELVGHGRAFLLSHLSGRRPGPTVASSCQSRPGARGKTLQFALTRLPAPRHRQGTTHPCRRSRNSRSGPCAGTAGGTPRPGRTPRRTGPRS